MPTFTKQDVINLRNAVMLMERGKYELSGAEARVMNKVLEGLVALCEQGAKEIKDAEVAAKAAEEAKAKEVAKAVETTKSVLDNLVAKDPVVEPKSE